VLVVVSGCVAFVMDGKAGVKAGVYIPSKNSASIFGAKSNIQHPKTPVGVLDGWILPSKNTFWMKLDIWMRGRITASRGALTVP
jgi:hypothetical protein